MSVAYPQQSVHFESLRETTLDSILGLSPPATLAASKVFRQLRYVEAYVRDPQLGCTTIAVEEHYIDRDFMEDHSVFYGRSLQPYPNSCRRVHFFRGEIAELQDHFATILERGRQFGDRKYRELCAEFSERHYFGFAVIKPLAGTPLGRTVLRAYPSVSPDGHRRSFTGTRKYDAHLLGVNLSIRGLAFQQQDVGVSACATTAIWTALQKTREYEDLGIVTPAHITTRATQARLPFGRSMPSEGLSVDQMAQAVQSFGVAPVLSRVDDFATARADLFAATKSGLAPVLVIESTEGGSKRHHAIAVVGMKLQPEGHQKASVRWRDAADDLVAVYIHDDRYGPYLRAEIVNLPSNQFGLKIRARRLDGGHRQDEHLEEWRVTHTLIPTPAKIRLSFLELRKLAFEAIRIVGAAWETELERRGTAQMPPIVLDIWVERSYSYLERVALSEVQFSPWVAANLSSNVVLSRYVGIIRLMVGQNTPIDVLVDMTGTFRNRAFLAVAAGYSDDPAWDATVVRLSKVLSCPSVLSGKAEVPHE